MKVLKNKKVISGIYIIAIIVLLITTILGFVFVGKGNNNLKTCTYVENTSLEYEVILNNGETYTQKDELAFVSSMIKSIKLKVNYHNDNDNYKDYKLSTDSILYIKPGAVGNEITKYGFLSREPIKNTTVNDINTEIFVEIDYQKYLTKLNEYINKNGLNNKTVAKLEIVTTIENKALATSNKSVVEISFLEEVMEIYASKVINNKTSTTLANNVGKFKLATLFSACCLIVVVVMFIFYCKLSKMSNYDRFVYKIFKFNKGVLVESNLLDVDTTNMIMVTNFKELLKVQSTVSLPIVYQMSETGCKFVIKVNNSGYYCIVNKE